MRTVTNSAHENLMDALSIYESELYDIWLGGARTVAFEMLVRDVEAFMERIKGEL